MGVSKNMGGVSGQKSVVNIIPTQTPMGQAAPI